MSTNKVQSEAGVPYLDEAAEQKKKEREDRAVRKALKILDNRLRKSGDFLTCPDMVKDYLRLRCAELQYEIFGVVFLTNRHEVIATEELFRGNATGAHIPCSEVARECLTRGAVAVIFYHNHPSGLTAPSQADRRITQRLKDALALIEVKVLDHIIVGTDSYSFVEHGIL